MPTARHCGKAARTKATARPPPRSSTRGPAEPRSRPKPCSPPCEPRSRPQGGADMADPAAGPTGDAGLADQVRLLFDAKAATWPAKYAPDGSRTGRLAQFAEGLAGQVAAGGRVLDLGCGTGNLARAADAAGLRVTACDISAKMLRQATSGDRGGAVDWVPLEPRWARLPFESAAFDAVVAASVLEERTEVR